MTPAAASAEVVVPVDPLTAFTAFTDEIDAWWVRGPINFFDSGRAVAMRIEPGVGGRVLEIYEEGGAALELGRITVWEPGLRLTYESLVDDTEVDVTFEAAGEGTLVRVTQALVPGGEKAFYFWPNVLRWLGPWCEEREGVPAKRREIARLSLALYYRDPLSAARWLMRVFQLGSRSGIPEGDDAEWIELHHGDVALILFPLGGEGPTSLPVTHMPWAYVDDLEAHLAHVKAEGGTIVSGVEHHGYSAYVAEDLEGRRWTFAQARPTMT